MSWLLKKTRLFLELCSSPRLFWVIRPQQMMGGEVGEVYEGNRCEVFGQQLMSLVSTSTEVVFYCSPLWLPFFYTRVFTVVQEQPVVLFKMAVVMSTLFLTGILIRSAGRMASDGYIQFHMDRKKGINMKLYDYDFSHYPVSFKASNTPSSSSVLVEPGESITINSITNSSGYYLHRALGWLLVHTVGLKLIYPGSTRWLLQPLVSNMLITSRAALVVKQGGQRCKIETAQGYHVDAMFFDRRGVQSNGSQSKDDNEASLKEESNGEREPLLVIVCEGNAGFYELGMTSPALEQGQHSVLGWNQPGFAGSNGSPLPMQTVLAADAVMQYAMQVLGFRQERIVVYGWSIGGFPATWLAMKYKNVRGLILDGTFHSLLPLALKAMPDVMGTLVHVAIESFVNLDVGTQLIKFEGPVRLVRRTRDDIITTSDRHQASLSPVHNLANDLLKILLRARFPKLYDEETEAELDAYLAKGKAGQESILGSRKNANEIFLQQWLRKEVKDEDVEDKVDLILALANVYMQEFDANHVQPLPPAEFRLPHCLSGPPKAL